VTTTKPTILVIDDEASIRMTLRMILEYEGYEVEEAEDGRSGLQRYSELGPDLVLLDVKMPKLDGLEVLEKLRAAGPLPPVLVMSGHGTIQTAVKATQMGAYDFLEKPLEKDRILLSVRNALERTELKRHNQLLRQEVGKKFSFVGGSAAIQKVLEQVDRAAPTMATLLITGESGTGKELIGRLIHDRSRRAGKPFVQVNCAAIPEELIENELFGHVKGAYTGASDVQLGHFEQADGGTIFLDEIGDMSLKTQAKVLRVLQEKEFQRVGSSKLLTTDVRVIAATNKDLKSAIGDASFREDLYFRLAVIVLHVPPLRERTDDIPALVEYFTSRFCQENGLRPKRFSEGAVRSLQAYHWPGNVRELRNTVERTVIMNDKDVIEPSDLPAAEFYRQDQPEIEANFKTLREFKDYAEKVFLVKKLNEFDWNIKRTAEEIETQRSNLYKKLEQYKLNEDEHRDR
jgi:two-component system, NtrC family, nitrogen regulation response regulator NtrX